MAGVAGRSGTNKGKDKPFRDALRLQLAAAGDDMKALRQVADALIASAQAGDIQAIREIGDRLDGKPAQALDITAETTHTYVARMPAPVKGMDEWQSRYSPNQTQPEVPKTKQ